MWGCQPRAHWAKNKLLNLTTIPDHPWDWNTYVIGVINRVNVSIPYGHGLGDTHKSPDCEVALSSHQRKPAGDGLGIISRRKLKASRTASKAPWEH